jgi:hypothetical protein
MSFLDRFKTDMRIAADVIRGRAFAETLIPEKRNHVTIEKISVDGTRTLLMDGYNSRTNAGAAWQAGIMGSESGNPANFIALSTATLSPSATDTTLFDEIIAGDNSGNMNNTGLARARGTYGHYVGPASLGGSASYQITNTFTSSATSVVNSAALFDAGSGGNLFVEANLNPAASLASGDMIILTWNVQI